MRVFTGRTALFDLFKKGQRFKLDLKDRKAYQRRTLVHILRSAGGFQDAELTTLFNLVHNCLQCSVAKAIASI